MDRICLVTFSNNADHQNVVYSMFDALQGKADVYTIGMKNPKSYIAPHTERNYYFDCPDRPGIRPKTMRIDIVIKMARLVKKLNIRYLYFESLHVWNLFLMWMCPQCVLIEAVHDVVPHDLSSVVRLCTKIICQRADHVILRNEKYMQLFSDVYRVPLSRITCFALWRYFPPEDRCTHSGKFLFFGRIRKYKGLDKLEEFIKNTPDIAYQVVGKPDEKSKPALETIRQYNNVELVDHEVTDLEMIRFFHEADWVIIPYLSATQSGVIVDSYKFSRPIIAFNVGAICEQIEDGVTGFLIEAENEKMFIEAIRKAASMSDEETEQFAHRAYMKGYNMYAAVAAANSFLEMLTHLKKVLPGA